MPTGNVAVRPFRFSRRHRGFVCAMGAMIRRKFQNREGEAPAEPSQMVWSRPSDIEIGTSFAASFPPWLKEVPWELNLTKAA